MAGNSGKAANYAPFRSDNCQNILVSFKILTQMRSSSGKGDKGKYLVNSYSW